MYLRGAAGAAETAGVASPAGVTAPFFLPERNDPVPRVQPHARSLLDCPCELRITDSTGEVLRECFETPPGRCTLEKTPFSSFEYRCEGNIHFVRGSDGESFATDQNGEPIPVISNYGPFHVQTSNKNELGNCVERTPPTSRSPQEIVPARPSRPEPPATPPPPPQTSGAARGVTMRSALTVTTIATSLLLAALVR